MLRKHQLHQLAGLAFASCTAGMQAAASAAPEATTVGTYAILSI
jgi:hypothetical protein